MEAEKKKKLKGDRPWVPSELGMDVAATLVIYDRDFISQTIGKKEKQ